MAGVPRASLVVVAAVLPMFGLPEAGLLLIMGIDQFLDMGRTATNVIGNGIATAVVAKWEGAAGRRRCPRTQTALDAARRRQRLTAASMHAPASALAVLCGRVAALPRSLPRAAGAARPRPTRCAR